MGKGSALSRIESVEAGSLDAGERYSQNALEEHQEAQLLQTPVVCLIGSHPSNFIWMMPSLRIPARLLISPQVAINYFSNSYQTVYAKESASRADRHGKALQIKRLEHRQALVHLFIIDEAEYLLHQAVKSLLK
jgi:hypothetical protein